MDTVFTISNCEVCGSEELTPVLDLGSQPLCDDLIPIGGEEHATTYPIELYCCGTCLTTHQKYQVAKKTLFPESYHYRSGMTEDVKDGMRDLSARCESILGGLVGKSVLDIGCNDGTLLTFFKEKGALTTGIEPTGAAKSAVEKGHDIIQDYFGEKTAKVYVESRKKPDVITFTNVFAHIEDLNDVLSGLRLLCHEKTIVVIENHYLGAVLERYQFDTFYHEHPRTYSYRSFEYIGKKLKMGIQTVEFPKRYNGNIRIVFSPGGTSVQAPVYEDNFLQYFVDMKRHMIEQKRNVIFQLEDAVKKYGPVPAKAFPGRSAVLLSYFGIDETMISAAYERSGSPKIGHYIPGTRIPILDEKELFDRGGSEFIVNLAWHIKDEIHQYLRKKNFEGKIMEIYS
ncbi:class I SAM-dependent methyltransferase [Thalassospira sp.]|uniref:class I SAM-dependent methyltransferase n=1 Tax=Thalassospira sp. TaxID=1912094 RepID=UPI000C4257E2|nr:class I SAM-dependent methyltransferase [Thalassospira sp.]MAL41056.1 methyltransferase [Thalassospira sp.]|tara:strand:- start:4755 stop:5948 length:1194 start_codon:yes stop_codon:yes gene_type:complete